MDIVLKIFLVIASVVVVALILKQVYRVSTWRKRYFKAHCYAIVYRIPPSVDPIEFGKKLLEIQSLLSQKTREVAVYCASSSHNQPLSPYYRIYSLKDKSQPDLLGQLVFRQLTKEQFALVTKTFGQLLFEVERK